MQPFSLPDNFLFGTATASLQIEGGDRERAMQLTRSTSSDISYAVRPRDHALPLCARPVRTLIL